MSRASDLYQKTADALRKGAIEKLRPNDAAHTLLTLAANQLENAADTARMLEELIDKGGLEEMIDPKKRPRNDGQWETDREAEVNRARLEGFALGIGLMVAGIIAVVALA